VAGALCRRCNSCCRLSAVRIVTVSPLDDGFILCRLVLHIVVCFLVIIPILLVIVVLHILLAVIALVIFRLVLVSLLLLLVIIIIIIIIITLLVIINALRSLCLLFIVTPVAIWIHCRVPG